MAEQLADTQTQTQTQSQDDWSQASAPCIPVIWGRLYPTISKSKYKNCWNTNTHGLQEYYDLENVELMLGRAVTCDFVMTKNIIDHETLKNVSKQHFLIKRDPSKAMMPAIIYDLSYNGTFINGTKIGKGKSRVLDDNDEIAVTHPVVKMFIYKDLLKCDQEKVPTEISKKYYISKTLGNGACGVVKEVFDKVKCTRYAMKIIKKNKITNGQVSALNDPQKIMNEVNILKSLKHPCIVSTEEIFDSNDAVYIVLELMEGGELFDRILKLGRLTETQTKLYFRQMVLAVKYLHSRGITHRDLKPENVLLDCHNNETLVKLTDFGLSKFVGEESFMRTMCGTPLYVAPEVLLANGQNTYGQQVDVWSLGVIFFICLSGYLPFSNDYKKMSLREQIIKGQYTFSQSHWQGVSMAAIALMRRMLTVNPEKRITLDELLQDQWMQDPEVLAVADQLMNGASETKSMSQLSISCNDEENRTSQKVIAAKAKRMLSDNNNSSEPVPKKMRLGLCAPKTYIVSRKSDETNSASCEEAE